MRLPLRIVNKDNIVEVAVAKEASICLSRHNRVYVKYYNTEYKYSISRQDCESNKYQVGNKLNVYFDKNKQEILSLNYSPYYMMIIGYLLSLFCIVIIHLPNNLVK